MAQQVEVAENGLEPLGDRLRARRQEMRLTLKEVALGAGLSVGFISQIERGITSPSLSSLVSVARVLRMEVGEFLSQPRPQGPITRHHQRHVYAVSPNSLAYERISSSFDGSVLRSVIIHEPPATDPNRSRIWARRCSTCWKARSP